MSYVLFDVAVSKALIRNVILFPLSSVAFLVVYLDQVLIDWVDGDKRISPEICDRCAVTSVVCVPHIGTEWCPAISLILHTIIVNIMITCMYHDY